MKQVVSDVEAAYKGAREGIPGLLYGVESARSSCTNDESLTATFEAVVKIGKEWQTAGADAASATLDVLGPKVDQTLEELIAKEQAEGLAAWRKWLKDDADMGSGHAHASSRLPQAWIPKEAMTTDGILSGDPTALMEGERLKFMGLWLGSEEDRKKMEGVGAWTDGDRLRAITSDDIAQASRTFKNGTSSTFDGLHPRHFSMLSPGGRQATAELLEFCEHTGEWPKGIDEVVISLIPKATGGTRPIGLFSGLYRLWTRVRRVEASEWEQKNSRDFFAATVAP